MLVIVRSSFSNVKHYVMSVFFSSSSIQKSHNLCHATQYNGISFFCSPSLFYHILNNLHFSFTAPVIHTMSSDFGLSFSLSLVCSFAFTNCICLDSTMKHWHTLPEYLFKPFGWYVTLCQFISSGILFHFRWIDCYELQSANGLKWTGTRMKWMGWNDFEWIDERGKWKLEQWKKTSNLYWSAMRLMRASWKQTSWHANAIRFEKEDRKRSI